MEKVRFTINIGLDPDSGDPFVRLVIDSEESLTIAEIPPAEAERVGKVLLGAAEGATWGAALYKFLTREIDAPQEMAMDFLEGIGHFRTNEDRQSQQETHEQRA